MSTYDEIEIDDVACPFCGNRQSWIVQFSIGDCWNTRHRLGDKFNWAYDEKIDYGEPTSEYFRGPVVTVNSCSFCGKDQIDGLVYVKNGVFEKVELIEEEMDFGDSFYEILPNK